MVTAEKAAPSIRLPLTLAVIEGFWSGWAIKLSCVPLEHVTEYTEFREQRSLEAREGSACGETQYIRLRHMFSVTGETPKRENVVIS